MEGINVYTKIFDAPELDRAEIRRYARVSCIERETENMIDSCLKECLGELSYKVCYAELPCSVADDTIDTGAFSVRSAALSRVLRGYDGLIVFAATVGARIDRLIQRCAKLSPARAVIFQAIGAERVESLCKSFSLDLAKEYAEVGNRFSPGYGDLPLEFQRDVFSLILPERYIGVTLSDSLIMSPSKSVTAVLGISKARF